MDRREGKGREVEEEVEEAAVGDGEGDGDDCRLLRPEVLLRPILPAVTAE